MRLRRKECASWRACTVPCARPKPPGFWRRSAMISWWRSFGASAMIARRARSWALSRKKRRRESAARWERPSTDGLYSQEKTHTHSKAGEGGETKMHIDMNALHQPNLRPSRVPKPQQEPLANRLTTAGKQDTDKGTRHTSAPKTAPDRPRPGKTEARPRPQAVRGNRGEHGRARAETRRARVSLDDRGRVRVEPACREHKPGGEKSFSTAYEQVAQANGTAHKAAKQVTEKNESHAQKGSGAQPQACQCECVPEQTVLDAPVANTILEELASKLGIESGEGLVEVLKSEEPGPELLEAIQKLETGELNLDAAELEGIDAQGNVITSGERVRQEAWLIIRQSLTVVTHTFQLNVAADVQNMETARADEHVIRQFSDIIHALKQISGLLEKAAQENVALDIQGEVLEPQKAAAIEQTVRFEAFRLQIAFRMLGVGGEVNRQVAAQENQPVYQGIPQAITPSAISHSSLNIRQLFAHLVENTEEKIQDVVARLVAMAKKAEPEIQGRIIINHLNVGSLPQEPKPVELASFNSLVFRQILRLDTGEQNGNAGLKDPMLLDAGAAKEQAPASAQQGVFSSLFYKQTVSQVLHVTNEQQEATPQLAGRVAFQPSVGDIGVRMTNVTPYRTWEESVIMQVTERFSMAVKNGLHEIRLQLRPESLGEVHLKVNMDGEIVSAKIQVESQQVRQIIENNLQSLKNALAEHNFQAGDFDVNVGRGFGGEADQSARTGQSGGGLDSDTGAEESSGDEGIGDVALGSETGRRFGDNTIEYYA
ncbi:MAG: hypothetical protein GF418_00185 [Chitinivibrionales bacterium]|nr:hypothetical protein [Chitinivibrionales bacterium]MBD3394017.1 hypothetical protein [Chitinivibrionales bacterium]